MLGNYYGQPRQRSKGDRVRASFYIDRQMYNQVKEDAANRGMSIGAYLEWAVGHFLYAMGDLSHLEQLLEAKLLEVLMHRNAYRERSAIGNTQEY